MKKRKIFSLSILAINLLSSTVMRIRTIPVFDYITGEMVNVLADFWKPSPTLFNNKKITQEEYNNNFGYISKTKVERTTSNFYSDYPINNNKKDYVTDIFVGKTYYSNLFYSMKELLSGTCPNSYKQSKIYEETTNFSYSIGIELEFDIGLILDGIKIDGGFEYTHSTKEQNGVEITVSTHSAMSTYSHAKLYRVDLYVPIILEMYQPYNCASYIYFKDFKLFHLSDSLVYFYGRDPLQEFVYPYFDENGKLTPLTEKELYQEKYRMTKITKEKVKLINSNIY